MTEVAAPIQLIERQQVRIDRLHLAGQGHAAAQGAADHREGANQESTLQLIHQLGQVFTADRQALAFESTMQAVEIEITAAMAEQLPHQPLLGEGLVHREALDHIAENGAVQITPEQQPTVRLIQFLQVRKSPRCRKNNS